MFCCAVLLAGAHLFTGHILEPEELKKIFTDAGVDLRDPDKPIITMCGSGITGSVLAFGLHRVGHRAISLYDGSWTEWASDKECPIETNTAEEK